MSHPWSTTDTDNFPIKLYWSEHALERLKERQINKNVMNVTAHYLEGLICYTNNGCYYYCDTKNNVTYLVRNIDTEYGVTQNTIMTIYYRNPIQMARRICEIKKWNFNDICRDNLFGNCRRGENCRYDHKTI
tara:strand:+ start:52 stop:447 length:396 start_codon:yes stop_codon:yes gene_type:complete